jgi:hypothetical protein
MSAIEQIIREAMARGEFDTQSVPGKGKPIDLTAYFDTPEEIRLAYSVLKSADILPQEAELLKEIATLKEKLEAITNQAQKRKLLKTLEEKRLQFTMMMERQKKQSKGAARQ